MNKAELEKTLAEQKAALEKTQKELAALNAADVLRRITNSVSDNLDVCTRIASMTKDEKEVYIRKVTSLYESAFTACEKDFAELKRRKEERAAKRKERNAKLKEQQEQQNVTKPAQEFRQPAQQTVQNTQNRPNAGFGVPQN